MVWRGPGWRWACLLAVAHTACAGEQAVGVQAPLSLTFGPHTVAAPSVSFTLTTGTPVALGAAPMDPLEFKYNITLGDVCTGSAHDLLWPRVALCSTCQGHGAPPDARHTCPTCNGTGSLSRQNDFGTCTHDVDIGGTLECMERTGRQQVVFNCPLCQGWGTIPEGVCPECGGHRLVNGTTSGKLVTPKGVDTGHRITFAGQGNQGLLKSPGNAVFSLNVLPHENYTRDGSNLLLTVNVTLVEALLGFQRTLIHPNGTNIHVNVTEMSTHDAEIVLAGCGVPLYNDPDTSGDLVLNIHVSFPVELAPESKKKLSNLLREDKKKARNRRQP